MERLNRFIQYVDDICKGLKSAVTSVNTLLNYFSSSKQKLDDCLQKLKSVKSDVGRLKIQLLDCKADLSELHDAADILRKLFKDALDFGDLSRTEKREILEAAKTGDYIKLEEYLDTLHMHLEACYEQYKKFADQNLTASNSCREAVEEANAKRAEAGSDAESLRNSGKQKALQYAGMVVAGGLMGGVDGIYVLGCAIGAAAAGMPILEEAKAFFKAAGCSENLREECDKLESEFCECLEKMIELNNEMSDINKMIGYLSYKVDAAHKMRKLDNFYGKFCDAFKKLQDAIKQAKSTFEQ